MTARKAKYLIARFKKIQIYNTINEWKGLTPLPIMLLLMQASPETSCYNYFPTDKRRDLPHLMRTHQGKFACTDWRNFMTGHLRGGSCCKWDEFGHWSKEVLGRRMIGVWTKMDTVTLSEITLWFIFVWELRSNNVYACCSNQSPTSVQEDPIVKDPDQTRMSALTRSSRSHSS